MNPLGQVQGVHGAAPVRLSRAGAPFADHIKAMSQPDYILDLHSAKAPSAPNAAAPATPAAGRPWLAIHWTCCSVYSRIYRNAQATAYEGRCPRCGRILTVEISAQGTASRFFEAF
jgi:hypothetical protein